MRRMPHARWIAILLMFVASISFGVWADGPSKTSNTTPVAQKDKTVRSELRHRQAENPVHSGLNAQDETAIRSIGEQLQQAYQQKDAAGFAAAFTEDGEYADTEDSVVLGCKAIEQDFSTYFQAHPKSQVEVKLDVLRAIAPNVVRVQGNTVFRETESSTTSTSAQCRLICVRDHERWRIASLRESGSSDSLTHRDHLRHLEWMVGDWISEGTKSDIHFTCNWDPTGKFLIRDFSIHFAGRPTISGTQRIGYDSHSNRIRTWSFDSDGGFSEGFLQHVGEGWMMSSTGVTGVGELASAIEVFTPVDGHRITWKIANRIVGGNRLPDTTGIPIVRKPPAPAVESTPQTRPPR